MSYPEGMTAGPQFKGQLFVKRWTRASDGRSRGVRLASREARLERYERKRADAHKRLSAYHERQR